MERELTLRIVLENPPIDVDFGLQKGRGSDYETIQKQRSKAQGSKAQDLYFEFTVRVEASRKDGTPNFLGSLAQGPSGGRFIYIDIGTYAGQTETSWSRRLKMPLSGITWDMINRVLDKSDSVLETRVPGTGKDGGPSCATMKPFPGWKLVRSRRR